MAIGKEFAYWIEDNLIAFVEKKSETVNGVTSSWSTISTNGHKARIYGSKIPTNLTVNNLSSDLALPHFVDEACLAHIISEGYQDPRNLNPDLAGMFNGKAENLLREAKKKYRRNRQKGGFIKPYDF